MIVLTTVSTVTAVTTAKYTGVSLAFKGCQSKTQKFLNRHFIEVSNSY